ncbi:o-succinylbenzoate synthase [Candidatus Woesearchaeota archaeon]|jgi:o-succinylbenzoate synthase|nr:o-succinylbenzoate synthase [Candidatus Woesearchaeota archaeon]
MDFTQNSPDKLKIDKIELYQVRLKLITPFRTSFGELTERNVLLICIRSGKLVGWGESPHLDLPLYTSEFLESGKKLLQNILLPRIIGKELSCPDDIHQFFADIKGNNISKAGIEMAVWDLFSKKANLPLYKFIGSQRNWSEIGISIGIKDSPEELIADIKRYTEEGYRRIKVKIKPGWDVDIVKFIRSHFPSIRLMVDANSAYSGGDIAHLSQFDDYNLLMIEQPFSESCLFDHSELQAKIRTPVCLDESIHCLEDVKTAVHFNSCKIINIKPARVGGVSETIKIHDFCKEKNIPVWIGGMVESFIGKSFLDHLSTLPNFLLPGDNSDSARYFEEDLVKGGREHQNGIIYLSDEPGIGVVPDEELLSKHTIEQFSLEV